MMEFYNKHYIRVVDGIVTKGFSDAFENPSESDICINEKGGRHFEINGEINPPLFNEDFTHVYRYDTELRKATEAELAEELDTLKTETIEEPSTEDDILAMIVDQEYRLTLLELGV